MLMCWWPFSGIEIDDASLPMVDRGWGWSIALELLGFLIAILALAEGAQLSDPANRRRFVSSGLLDFTGTS